ncbi:MAG: tryptophan synthase subunit alpha [Candidatus Eiseniibacteriota bacterium]
MTRPAHSALEARLRGLREERRAGLVPYLTAGYPDLETTNLLLSAVADAGAVAIELGIPFSDPLADGPALQEASQVALEKGVTVRDVFELARVFAERTDTPLVAMTYANPVLAYGVERFARDARTAGISGVIVSDLPVEERPDVWNALRAGGLDTIPLVAPTTALDRLDRVLARASGFVYCLSRTGVTGDARAFASELDGLVAEVRRRTDLPVGIGFGVGDEEKARFVAARAEAVIVGAALARRIAEASRAGGTQAIVDSVSSFARSLAGAIAGTVKASV